MSKYPIIRTGIGQDSHRFVQQDVFKPCIIAGIEFEKVPGLAGNSDADVVFHAICNAISSLTGEIILGGRADELFQNSGITDSQIYLEEALKTLGNQEITHVSVTLEGLRPHFLNKILMMRAKIAEVMKLDISQVGITATSGEGLTDFGCGDGVQCFCIVTTMEFNESR